MKDRSFIDTNLFVYASGQQGREKGNLSLALIRTLLANRTGVISFQVIQEFFNVALKKFSPPYSTEDAHTQMVEIFQPLIVVHSSMRLYTDATEIFVRHKLSWYDSLLVAAAAEAGCSVLYTEDMQHGTTIRGVRIVNPFLTN